MTRRSLQVDVFGESPYPGNPLAVVLDADGIDAVARGRTLQPSYRSGGSHVPSPRP